MHEHVEIIIPPTDDVITALTRVLEPFDINLNQEYIGPEAFWDYWILGGGCTEHKIESQFNPIEIKKFKKALKDKGVEISDITCTEATPDTETKIKIINSVWRDYFPGKGDTCPILEHYKDRDNHNKRHPVIMMLKDMPSTLVADRVIIAAHNRKMELKARYMTQREFWNGLTMVNTTWDGYVKRSLEEYLKKLHPYERDLYTPGDDWLVATVDCHH